MRTPSLPFVAASESSIPPLGVPGKFLADGTVQSYPGNTIICHLPAGSPVLPGLEATYKAYAAHATLRRYIRLLPPASWHMTVLDGAREFESEPGMWPEGLEKKPLAAYNADYEPKLRELGRCLAKEDLSPPYRMRVTGFEKSQGGMGLAVEGATPHEEKRMRKLRDRLADTLGFKAPNHERYRFHITVSYLLLPPAGEHKAEMDRLQAELLSTVTTTFDLDRLEFCTYQDMEAFARSFYLGD